MYIRQKKTNRLNLFYFCNQGNIKFCSLSKVSNPPTTIFKINLLYTFKKLLRMKPHKNCLIMGMLHMFNYPIPGEENDILLTDSNTIGFKEKYRLSLFKLSKLYLNTGNYLQALETLKILIDKDPLCEAVTRMLMITSALIRSRSNIPRILDNLNRQLMEEYDVSADKKTVQFMEILLSGGDPKPEM